MEFLIKYKLNVNKFKIKLNFVVNLSTLSHLYYMNLELFTKEPEIF